jgi:hypothetical protein
MFLRYAILIALAGVSLYAVLVTGASTGQTLMAQTGPNAHLPNAGLWALAVIAALSTISLFRFMLYGVPAILANWYYDHRDWLATLLLGGLVLLVFYWL